MRILILDDDSGRHKVFNRKLIGHAVDNVFEAHEAIDLLKGDKYDIVFLDHDLGNKSMVASGPGTGYEVAQWLRDNPDKQPNQVVIHSFNPVGAKNIKAILQMATVYPGVWTDLEKFI